MKNKDKVIRNLQELTIAWLSNFEYRSLDMIKSNCDSLDESYELRLSNPIWSIFWPLVYHGLVDHIGNSRYALTAPLVVDCRTHYYCMNFIPLISSKSNEFPGIYLTTKKPKIESIKVVTSNILNVLNRMPSINYVVDSFPKTLQDETNLEYYNKKSNMGIAKLERGGTTRFFSIPKELYIRELPNRNLNPEAFAIAYCLSRCINNEGNGRYVQGSKKLYLPKFAIPFTIYRLLLLEAMNSKILPIENGDEYLFQGISLKTVKEINRIFCNSISYE